MKIAGMLIRLGSANVAMLAIHVLTIGVLGALAPASQFGLFLLALSISQLFSSFAGFRLESAFPAIEDLNELGAMLAMAATSAAVISLLQFLLVQLLARLSVFELDSLALASLILLPLITFMQALVQIGRLWAIRFGEIAKVARSTYIRGGATLILRGTIAVMLFVPAFDGLRGQITAYLLSAELLITAAMTVSLFPFKPTVRHLAGFEWSTGGRMLRENWKFPLLEAPSTFLDNAAVNAPLFLVTQFFGLGATASFGLAFRGLAVPVAQISKTLTEVMQVRYSEFQRGGDFVAFRQLFRQSTLLMSVAVAVGMVVLLGGAFLLDSYLENRVRQFVIIVLIISPWVAGSAIVNINSRLLLMLRRQELKLFYDCFSILMVGLLVVLYEIANPGLYEFVAIISATQVSGYLLYWFLIRKTVYGLAASRSFKRTEVAET